MTRRYPQPRTFDPGKPCLVRRPFTANGRRYEKGDSFDWRKLAVSQRRVAQLYLAGKLSHADVEPDTRLETVEPKAPDPVFVDVQDDYESMTLSDLQALARESDLPTRRSRSEQISVLKGNEEESLA